MNNSRLHYLLPNRKYHPLTDWL